MANARGMTAASSSVRQSGILMQRDSGSIIVVAKAPGPNVAILSPGLRP